VFKADPDSVPKLEFFYNADGCSGPLIPNEIRDVLTPACNSHDACFTCKDYVAHGRNRMKIVDGRVRVTDDNGWWDTLDYCNEQFNNNMSRLCTKWYNQLIEQGRDDPVKRLMECGATAVLIDTFVGSFTMGGAYRNNIKGTNWICSARRGLGAEGRFFDQLNADEQAKLRHVVDYPFTF
jgi:hypothetical protein